MRRFYLGLATCALPALALTLFVAGCGDKKDNASQGGGGGGGGSGNQTKDPTKKADVKVLEPAGGVLKGKITLKNKPDLDKLTKELVNKIEAKTDDKEYCLKCSESEKTEQEFRVGKNGNLGNVFVWVVPEPGTSFKVDKKQIDSLPKEVVLRQPHCAFIPHCLFLFAEYTPDAKNPSKKEKTGQKWKIVNDAEITHNTNWGSVGRNKGDNVILAKGKDRVVTLVPAQSPLEITCDIHKWMNAHMWVIDTPYYAISHSDTLDGKDKVDVDDPKFGTFEIKDLPAGDVRVKVYHEKLQWLNEGGKDGQKVTITAGKETEKNFEGEVK